jgi:hypothetical protein
MALTKFDRPTLQRLRTDIEAALAAVSNINPGLKLTLGKVRFTDVSFTVDLRASVVWEGGADLGAKAQFEAYAPAYGLDAADFGKTFVAGRGTAYRIAGVQPRRHTRPILGERVEDGKRFIFTIEEVRRALGHTVPKPELGREEGN